MDLQYQLKAGNYYLYDMRDAPSAVTGERRFKLKTDTVAIAFDLFTGQVHQHGNPTRIQSWAAHHRRRLRAAGALAEANDLVVVSGPLPVDELNKCLWIRGLLPPHVQAPGPPAARQAAALRVARFLLLI